MNVARLPPERPLVVAHRGASGERAEHTLAAYELAIEVGADALECDLRLTRDGQLVCIHDRTLDRTSDGSGVVSTLTLAQLQHLDFASWHGLPSEDTAVLTLEALLGLMKDSGRPVRLMAETKHPTRYGGRVEQQLATALRYYGWAGTGPGEASRVTMMSFAGTALRRMRELLPELPLVLLKERAWGVRRTGLLPPGVQIAGPSLSLLRMDPGYVERTHALGNRVYVWTVDEPADLHYVLALGVDAIITNRPGQTIAILDQQR